MADILLIMVYSFCKGINKKFKLNNFAIKNQTNWAIKCEKLRPQVGDMMSYILFIFGFACNAVLIVFSLFSFDISSLRDSYVICCNCFYKYQIPDGIKTCRNQILGPVGTKYL